MHWMMTIKYAYTYPLTLNDYSHRFIIVVCTCIRCIIGKMSHSLDFKEVNVYI